MKKRAVMAAVGLLTVVGAAGGADSVPLWQTVLCMAAGFALMLYAEHTVFKRRRKGRNRGGSPVRSRTVTAVCRASAVPGAHSQHGLPSPGAERTCSASEAAWRQAPKKRSLDLC